jgi:EmrB/QacA subfamily drug resistance transporter
MVNQSQKARLVVVATMGAAFLAGLDLFVVNVAFDAIGADLGVGQPGGPSAADLSWILSGYAVVYAALLVPLGRLADRVGPRRVFVSGLVVFLAASAACATAWSVGALVGFRLVQAAGAAAMTPTSLAILLTALPAARRASGVRVWAAVGAVAAAIGPTVGGVLTQFGWQWVFLINLPVGIAIVAVALWVVPSAHVREDGPMPDLAGAVLVALSVGLLALGLVKTPEWGWNAPATIACLLGAALLAGAFWRRSSRHRAPVVDPELLRIRTFRWAAGSMVLFNAAFAVSLLAGILWLQQIWGWSAMETGFAVAVGPILVPVTAAVVNRWFSGMSAGALIAIGCLACATGMSMLALRLGPVPDYARDFLPGWALVGIGVGFALPSLMAGATVDLAADQRATGSGVITMARQIGFVVGVSLLFAIVGDRTGPGLARAFEQAWWVAAAIALAGVVASLRMRVPAPLAVAA